MGNAVSGRYYVEWQMKKLGEGASRWTYPAKVMKGTYKGWKAGTELVVKVIKAKLYNQGLRIGKEDVRAQEITIKYAREFNAEQKPRKNGQSCNVYALRASIGTADSNKLENGVVRVFRGEKFLVERRIFGVYEKFNSNSGWSAGNGLLPDFFSHWSYVHSGRKLLLCDLQGHKGRPGGPKYGSEEYYYLFTDTAVLSEGQCYGCTDLGPEGMKDWFAHHVCNDMCKKANIEGIRAAPLRYPPALPQLCRGVADIIWPRKPQPRKPRPCRRRSVYSCE